MKRAAAVAAILISSSAPVKASALRTKFGMVTVRGLKIGQEYSLNSLVNLPFRVVNIGYETEDVKIFVNRGKKASVEGYEVIPDTSWIRLDKQGFSVEPNHEAVTDIHISIPNDAKFLGRRFEVQILSQTTPGRHNMYGAGLISYLLIEVSSIPTEDELKKKFVDKHLANLDFTLYPTEGNAVDVPLGVDFDLKKERKLSIKLVNPNDVKLNFRLRSIAFWETQLALPDTYVAGRTPSWVRPASDVVTVEGNSIKDTALILNIPDEDDLRGKNLVFAVSVEVLEQEISARVYYKLLVKTQAKQGADKAGTGKEN